LSAAESSTGWGLDWCAAAARSCTIESAESPSIPEGEAMGVVEGLWWRLAVGVTLHHAATKKIESKATEARRVRDFESPAFIFRRRRAGLVDVGEVIKMVGFTVRCIAEAPARARRYDVRR